MSRRAIGRDERENGARETENERHG